MDTMIKVKNLGKQYRIGSRQACYKTLRESLTNAVTGSFRRLRGPFTDNRSSRLGVDTVWALKDVSFEVKQGEVVGIIGRNGAGKTTLLKILSRITRPTEGCVEIHGRVGSLLEVGTGFHPELTGRENIYLSGAIMGMRKVEINRKFDQIIAFAEIEKFLDTPIKRYSSGMYMRLAFAVAAHLEPEILLVDEVLAVGDAAFQKKCLGKMGDVAKEGRTVLFVSHNMAAVLNLCRRAILVEAGRIVVDGMINEVVDKYLRITTAQATGISLEKRIDRKGNQIMRFISFQLLNGKHESVSQATTGQDLKIAFYYESESNKPIRNVHVAIGIHGRYDENLFHLSTDVQSQDFYEIPPKGVLICYIPHLPLQPGKYSFNLFAMVGKDIADWIQSAGVIDVDPADFFGSGKLPPANQGCLLVEHSWQIILNR